MANDPKAAPAPAPVAASSKGKAKRAKRVLTAFEQAIADEQKVARQISRKLAGLSEESRNRIVQMIATYTASK